MSLYSEIIEQPERIQIGEHFARAVVRVLSYPRKRIQLRTAAQYPQGDGDEIVLQECIGSRTSVRVFLRQNL